MTLYQELTWMEYWGFHWPSIDKRSHSATNLWKWQSDVMDSRTRSALHVQHLPWQPADASYFPLELNGSVCFPPPQAQKLCAFLTHRACWFPLCTVGAAPVWSQHTIFWSVFSSPCSETAWMKMDLRWVNYGSFQPCLTCFFFLSFFGCTHVKMKSSESVYLHAAFILTDILLMFWLSCCSAPSSHGCHWQ